MERLSLSDMLGLKKVKFDKVDIFWIDYFLMKWKSFPAWTQTDHIKEVRQLVVFFTTYSRAKNYNQLNSYELKETCENGIIFTRDFAKYRIYKWYLPYVKQLIGGIFLINPNNRGINITYQAK
jgi:hypothetical protein